MIPSNILMPLRVAMFFIIAIPSFCQSDTIQHIVAGRSNSVEQQKKPYVIMISADGMRADFITKYFAQNLLRYSDKGAHADYMLPSFPSLTFPNHYTLATGLYPGHHGLVDNTFYSQERHAIYDTHDIKAVNDSIWYGGTPIWVLAEQQKMLSASFYWVGSNAPIHNILPTYSYQFNTLITIRRRLQIIREWLTLPEEKRPHLLMLYFPEVDHEAHDFGPVSKETESAVRLIDETLGKLVAMTDSLHLPVDYVFVSDHGLTQVDTEKPISIPSLIQDTTICKIIAGNTMVHVYLKDKSKRNQVLQTIQQGAIDYQVFAAEDIPLNWHYTNKDRVGDIILVAQHPKVFKLNNRKITPGKHGYDPTLIDMHATFLAWGPHIKPMRVAPFENVNVFPLAAKLLGLPYQFKIDGEEKVLGVLVKSKKN